MNNHNLSAEDWRHAVRCASVETTPAPIVDLRPGAVNWVGKPPKVDDPCHLPFDDGYGHVDEVEAHWRWIFLGGFILGGAITSLLWTLL